jgi:hypothetical protein
MTKRRRHVYTVWHYSDARFIYLHETESFAQRMQLIAEF